MLNGAVIVETVFGFPGVGKLMIDAIIQRDFALVQAAIIVTAAAIFILNILVDIAYALLDPRIRHALRWRARTARRRRFPSQRGALASALAMLWRDKLACAASVFLLAHGVLRGVRPGAARRRRHRHEPASMRNAPPRLDPAGLALHPGRRRARPQRSCRASSWPPQNTIGDRRRGGGRRDGRGRRARACSPAIRAAGSAPRSCALPTSS